MQSDKVAHDESPRLVLHWLQTQPFVFWLCEWLTHDALCCAPPLFADGTFPFILCFFPCGRHFREFLQRNMELYFILLSFCTFPLSYGCFMKKSMDTILGK